MMIRGIDEVDAAWVQAALAAGGALREGSSVASVAVVEIGVGVGLVGRLFRLTPTYVGQPGPATAVLKLPTDDAGARFMADTFRFFPREIGWYQRLRAESGVRSPAGYLAEIDPESGDFVLLMEDIGHLRSPDQIGGISADEADAALTQLANLHARWWEHPELDELASVYLPVKNDLYPVALPMAFDPGWAIAKAELADAIPTEVIPFGDRWSSLVPWLLDGLSTSSTLLHGDFRADNLLFDETGEPTIIDFQVMGIGAAPYDAAYLLSQSMTPELRAAEEQRLLRAHWERLRAAGVTGYPFEQCWDEYRVALLFCLVYPMTALGHYDLTNERTRELAMTMLARSTRAIAETGALDLVPSDP
jgi:hypothetical protein